MNKKAYAFFLKKNRRKNPIAQDLRDGRYQPRVVESKKVYNRKKHGKTNRHNEDSNSS